MRDISEQRAAEGSMIIQRSKSGFHCELSDFVFLNYFVEFDRDLDYFRDNQRQFS